MTENWEGEEKSCIDTDWENLIWLKIKKIDWLLLGGGVLTQVTSYQTYSQFIMLPFPSNGDWCRLYPAKNHG